jgi:transcriptional regulator with XRE-family HTH domain
MWESVIERLTLIRKRAGYNCKELSKAINKNENYISRLERKTFYPPLDEIGAILDACNSSFVELFYDDYDTYMIDQEIINQLKQVNENGKSAIVTLLAIMLELKLQAKVS